MAQLTGSAFGVLDLAAFAAVVLLALCALAERRARGRSERQAHSQAIALAKAASHAAATAERLAALTEERDGLTDALHVARTKAAALERALDAARLTAAHDAELASRETALLRDLRSEMSDRFRLLADDSLRRQGEDLERAHGERLAALLTPFREQVAQFQDELRAGQRSEAEAQAALREQIEGLHRRSQDIGREAVALTRALRGDKQRQGAWGEMILASALEAAGLIEGQHYRTQVHSRDADGRAWRPDVVVDLPGGRALVIDAKCSLNAYADACAADDPAARGAALRAHVAAVRAHVAELSGRAYQQAQDGIDQVLMFVPVEGALAEALRADPDLTRFALDRRVALVAPATLNLALRTVDHLWTVDRRNRNAAEIANRAGQLYDKLALMVEALDEAGAALDQAARAHHTAVARLSRGPGNVIRQAEMLRELGARTVRRIALDHDRAERPAAE